MPPPPPRTPAIFAHTYASSRGCTGRLSVAFCDLMALCPKFGNPRYSGGKKDDITLLIAKVYEADEPVSDSYPGGAPPPPYLPHGGGSPNTPEQASAQQWSGFSLASSL